MSQTSSIDEILDFAIDSEQAAVELYLGLAAKAESPAMKKVFEEYADEERGHKAKLTDVKNGKRFLESGGKPVPDMKISDYTVEEEPDPDADYQIILIYAMKKEKAAFKLYTDLAGKTEEPELKEMLLDLAQEEAKHKLHFEVEYDDNFLAEN